MAVPSNQAKLILGLGIIIIVGMIILAATVLSGKKPSDISDLKEKIRLQDSTIKADKKHIESNDKRYNEIKNEVIALEVKYQKIQVELNQTKDKLNDNKTRYDKIPSTVRNMSKDSLRRAVTGFKPE